METWATLTNAAAKTATEGKSHTGAKQRQGPGNRSPTDTDTDTDTEFHGIKKVAISLVSPCGTHRGIGKSHGIANGS